MSENIKEQLELLQRKKQNFARLIAAQKAKDSLIAFSRFMEPDPNAPDDVEQSLYVDRPHHHVIAEALEKAENGILLAKGTRFLCLSTGPQKGKLVADDTPVLSGRGWITHGELVVGDIVYGPDGAPCAVLAVSDQDMATLRVTFTDGSSFDVHPKHEWTVHDKRSNKHRTVETQWMAEQGLWLQKGGIKRTSGRKAEARFAVPPIDPIQMPDVDLPVEPYSLGAWLGDGSVGKPCITHSVRDAVVAETVGQNYPVSVSHVHSVTGVHTTSFAGDGWVGKAAGLTLALRTAGVLKNKHIPQIYFRASMRQRLELLAGLIDTDGCVHPRTNRWGFANANWQLCLDVGRLIATFGWRATFVEYPPKMSSSGIQGKKTVWQVTFSPDIFIPTRIARKNIARPTSVRRARGIASIEPVAPKPGRCIQVSRADGLYCIGNALIATHNSQLTSRNFISWMIGRNPKRNIMLGSYNDDFAREFGDDVRNIMQKPQYAQVFPGVRLRKGGKAKDHMVTEAGGKLSFVGRGGSGTGRPADCLPGSSIILTERGLMRLDDFISGGMQCRIASFDHCTYNQVWRPVIAWSARDAKEIYEIETESGRVIRATGNHKIFISGRGYIRASELSVGDSVLCGVWETGNFAQVSMGQESKKRLPEYLLQQRLSGGLIQQEVPMRQAKRLEGQTVLLKGMRKKIRSLRGAFTHALKHYVPTMREYFQAKIASNTILFERLCGLGTFGTNERAREFALQGWPLLCHVVRQDEGDSLGAGREQVQGLPDSRGAKSYFLAQQKSDAQRHDCPSYRRERDKQSSGELDLSLRNMPCDTSQVVCDAISVVRRIRCEGERVYDIQVEGTGNFFANEVLVHNCFIIDDPIKNFEEAESLKIRDTVWNWFLKVADSRTHGNSVIVAIQTRWQEDDLIGRLTDKTNPHYPEKMAAKTMYINIPSIVENAELAKLLKVPVGGSIWEEKFPLWLLEMKRDADPRGFGAMEMGRPTPPEGSFYKVGHVRQCYYRDLSQLPPNLTRYGSCDLAVSDDLKADDSVILDWGLDENDVLWLLPDCYWHKKKADASVDSLINMGKDKWMTLFAEKGVIDRAIGPFLEKRMMEMGAYFNVKTFTNVNKGHASHSFRARMAQGKVRFPVFAEWWQRAEEQMLKFTGSGDDREDDFCDALARIGQGIMMQVGSSKFTPQKSAKVIPIGSVGWARRLYDADRAKQKRTTRKYG